MYLQLQTRLKFDFEIDWFIAIMSDAVKRYSRLAHALFKFLIS